MTIANRVAKFTITVPPNTLSTAPLTTDIDLGDSWLQSIRVRIPPGHAGTTGLQVLNAGTPIVPWDDSVLWLIGDNEDVTYNVNTEANSTVTANAYNSGNWSHSFYLEVVYTPITLLLEQSTPALVIPVA